MQAVTTYAIGDIQGCYDPLCRLLEKIRFDSSKDRLWFCGDLVNRGGYSLAVLRLIHELRQSSVVVLGNHDLSLLADAAGFSKPSTPRNKEFEAIYGASDGEDLLTWLRQRPLLHHDPQTGHALVHAGLLPQWNLSDAKARAREVEEVLHGPDYGRFLRRLHARAADRWRDDIGGWRRLNVIGNALTRLRFCDGKGRMQFAYKGPPGCQPKGLYPWFLAPHRKPIEDTIVCGHWSALGYYRRPGLIALDSGCVWGGPLTAVDLACPERPIQVNCGR